MAVVCIQVFVDIMIPSEPEPSPVIISPPTPPVIVIPPLPPEPILIDGISTTDPGLANQQIIAYYQARVPSCDRWGYIHSTIEQKIKDWGTLRWGWDAGVLESTLRANISDNPCYVPPPLTVAIGNVVNWTAKQVIFNDDGTGFSAGWYSSGVVDAVRIDAVHGNWVGVGLAWISKEYITKVS